MQRFSPRAILAASVILFLAAPAAADFSISPVPEPADFQVVSPDSDIAQLVRLEDAEGDPVNRSRLEARENLVFRYNFNGTPSRMDYITEGYYYATFDSNSTGRTVTYELIDTSPTSGGEVNFTENLAAGKLDVDLLTDFSGSERAGDVIEVNARVENLMQYYAVDVDDSGSITDQDEFIIDAGGSGSYSEGDDAVLAGTPPENAQDLQSGNPWNSATNPLRVNDSASGDGWDDSNDIVLIDRNNGGTVSTGPDSPVNTGNDNDVDAQAGTGLSDLSTVSGMLYFVSSDQELESGEEIVYDNDSDGNFTRRPDRIIAGNTPNEGTPITYTDSISSSLGISSYDANAGDSWDGTTDVLARDYDGDGQYSARSGGDNVIAGATPDEGENLHTNGVSAWEDSGTDTATAGEVEVYDESTSDAWDPANDAIWLESGENPGFQSGQDTALAGNPQDGRRGSENANRIEQWETISFYRADSDPYFNVSEDAVIRDWHGGGTFSTREDFVIAGSVTGPIQAGTPYDNIGGLDEDWDLDVIDASVGGSWSSNQDTILIDYNEGGTYSATGDTVVNSGGSITASGGTDLKQLNTYVSSEKKWADLDSSGSYSSGDEIFSDEDSDGLYTARQDMQLAGISLNTAGAGTGLENGNPWGSGQKPLLFYDAVQGDGWNASEDAVVQDLDNDGKYTAKGDIVVSDEEGAIQAEPGDDIIQTARTNFTTPEVTIRFTNGSVTTEPVELGLKPDGDFTNTVELPDEAGSTYIVQVRAETQVSDLEGTESDVMTTRKRGIGFSSNTSVSMSASRAGIYTKNITLENFLDESNRIEVNVSNSLENITTSPDHIVLPASDFGDLQLEFNVTPAESYSGHVIFTENETGKTDRTEIDINGPSCEDRTERICVDKSSISVTAEERENQTRTVKVSSIWKRDEDLDVSAEVQGDISDYVELNATSLTFEDSETVQIKFKPEKQGDYSGQLVFTGENGSVSVDLSLEANVKQLDSGMSLRPSSVDLGSVPTGSDQTFTLEAENTGTLEITDFNVTSEQLSASSDIEGPLSPGSTVNFSVTLSSMSSETGTVTVTGQTSEGSVSGSTEVSSSFIKPVSEMKSKIRSRITNLRSKTTSSQIQTRLTNLETKISTIETQWQQGNYDQAQTIYQSTLSNLDSVESQISSSPSPTPPSGSTGEQQNSGQTGDTEDSSGEGGGGMTMIIVAVLLILILGAGFVIYTSYYPEEGDPLYDVLGDRE